MIPPAKSTKGWCMFKFVLLMVMISDVKRYSMRKSVRINAAFPPDLEFLLEHDIAKSICNQFGGHQTNACRTGNVDNPNVYEGTAELIRSVYTLSTKCVCSQCFCNISSIPHISTDRLKNIEDKYTII